MLRGERHWHAPVEPISSSGSSAAASATGEATTPTSLAILRTTERATSWDDARRMVVVSGQSQGALSKAKVRSMPRGFATADSDSETRPLAFPLASMTLFPILIVSPSAQSWCHPLEHRDHLRVHSIGLLQRVISEQAGTYQA